MYSMWEWEGQRRDKGKGRGRDGASAMFKEVGLARNMSCRHVLYVIPPNTIIFHRHKQKTHV